MLLVQFKVCLLSENTSYKDMEISSLLRLFPCFLVDVLEAVKQDEFQICFGARSLTCKQNVSQDNYKSLD